MGKTSKLYRNYEALNGQDDPGHLHAGSQSAEARGAEQSGRHDQAKIKLYRELLGKFLQLVDCIWRPRRDLNPCYRRESTGSDRKLLKLRNTDGYLKRFQ